MNSQENPLRLEEPSHFATNGKIALSRIATNETSIVPPEASIPARPADVTLPQAEGGPAPARWPLFVIAIGLVFSLAWSLGLAWMVGILFGVW